MASGSGGARIGQDKDTPLDVEGDVIMQEPPNLVVHLLLDDLGPLEKKPKLGETPETAVTLTDTGVRA